MITPAYTTRVDNDTNKRIEELADKLEAYARKASFDRFYDTILEVDLELAMLDVHDVEHNMLFEYTVQRMRLCSMRRDAVQLLKNLGYDVAHMEWGVV